MNKRRITCLQITSIVILCVLLGNVTGCDTAPPTKTLTLEDYPDYESDAVKLYVSRCGECHAAPLPEIHPAKQWPGVVQRMQFRMTSKAMPPLNDNELEIIVTYLEKHAK